MSKKAQDIRTGDHYEYRNERGHIIGGWTATGDAQPYAEPEPGEVKEDQVVVPVKYHDGGQGARIWIVDTDVPVVSA